MSGIALTLLALGLTTHPLPSAAGPNATQAPPVVRAVLFFSPTCPHCHEVI